ncbi:hypothetical protein [Celerinatantimonas yamalensis]|uniref:Glycosyl transferase family 8 n=1 Tax=Celerinatantimonas yamalensis TaxID=559956 RepID=A0ABW9G589_9GAMM
MNLVVVTFGDNIENHYQASFSILSFLKSNALSRIFVVTDRPSFYQYFANRIELIVLEPQQLVDWRGPHDFFWRIKMKAIELAALHCNGDDLLYVDSDTIYVKGIASIENHLKAGMGVMHECEGALSQLSGKTHKNMCKTLRGYEYGDLTIDGQSVMWNAGVIALPGNKAIETIQSAINVCDAMCETSCRRRLLEQFAFSVVIEQQLGLQAATQNIAHYWGNKAHWNDMIRSFFMYSMLTRSTLDEDIERFSPDDFIVYPTVIRERSIKAKLNRLVGKIATKETRFSISSLS